MSFSPGFERFWSAWPKNGGRYSRKGGKAQCLAVWNKNYNFTQVDQIVKHVEWLKTTEAWLKDQGAFIPAPLVYLNQQRWDGADIPELPKPVDETALVHSYVQQTTCRVSKDEAIAKLKAMGSRRVAK